MTEIAKFDPSKLMDGVRDRIKSTFVGMIPDEQWEQMIKKECDSFFQKQERQYYERTYFSDFEKVCQEVLVQEAKIKIMEFLEKYKSTIWDSYGIKTSEALNELIVANAPKIFASIFGNMFQSAINNIR